MITDEELKRMGQIPITFEKLQTWASVYNGGYPSKQKPKELRKPGRGQSPETLKTIFW